MAWKEIVDYTVPSNTTSVDITGLNITKDDFINMTITYNNSSAGNSDIRVFPNNQNNATLYHRQQLFGINSSVGAARINDNSTIGTSVGQTSFGNYYMKLSENNVFNLFLNYTQFVSSSVDNIFRYITSSGVTFPSGITSLTFTATQTNGLGANSRIQIYKLEAEKVADIIVNANTTQVDITGLDIQKGSEYLLVHENKRNGAGNVDVRLTINNDTTFTNYWGQRIRGDGSSTLASRNNNPYIATVPNHSIGYCHIKLSNTGAYTYQSYTFGELGTSSLVLSNWFGSSIAENISKITKLNIASNTNTIGVGSRYELYKLY